jgi:hypothetical protein
MNHASIAAHPFDLQTLEFCKNVDKDLNGYDEDEVYFLRPFYTIEITLTTNNKAWPSLLDNFVSWKKEKVVKTNGVEEGTAALSIH